MAKNSEQQRSRMAVAGGICGAASSRPSSSSSGRPIGAGPPSPAAELTVPQETCAGRARPAAAAALHSGSRATDAVLSSVPWRPRLGRCPVLASFSRTRLGIRSAAAFFEPLLVLLRSARAPASAAAGAPGPPPGPCGLSSCSGSCACRGRIEASTSDVLWAIVSLVHLVSPSGLKFERTAPRSASRRSLMLPHASEVSA
mmetsp:Transcript_87659/g.283811  ORF Transcript_87659/g.283811 Transcript_87659/m.283811 type:complete len:200 (+) Transcript_87659:133-732(+)